MAAIAFTLLDASPQRLTYSWTGDAAGTLAYATYHDVDAVPGPLKVSLETAAGQCTTDAKAQSALITGEAFTGGGAGAPTVRTRIQTRILSYTSVTTGKAPCTLVGKDSGAGNNPDLLVTPDAATSGTLTIEYPHSITW